MKVHYHIFFLHSPPPPFSSLLDGPFLTDLPLPLEVTSSPIIEKGAWLPSIDLSICMYCPPSVSEIITIFIHDLPSLSSHFSPLKWSTLEEVGSTCDYVESLSHGMDIVVGKLVAGGRDSVRRGVIGSTIHDWMGLGGWKTTGDTTTSRDYRIAVGICDRLMGWHGEGMR